MKKYLFYISQNYSFTILRPVQKLLKQRGDEVRWFFEGNAVNDQFVAADEQRLHSVPQIKAWKPDAVLATANSIPTFLPGLKVAVFHGFDAGKLDRRGQNDHFKIRGCFDLYCTQGPQTTNEFKKNQQKLGYFNVIETGWPALDPLFNGPDSIPTEKPTILFCSTFSKRLSCAQTLHAEIKRISQHDKWKWIVQFHPKMDQQTVKLYKSLQNENLTFIETDNIIPLLQQADIMLCDTSSVISMFIVQKKPVVTFNNIDPGPHLLNIKDSHLLEQTLDTALQRPEKLLAHIDEHIQHIHPYTDGKSAERVIHVIDEVMTGKYPLEKSKPLNLIRNIKFRKKLHYWGF